MNYISINNIRRKTFDVYDYALIKCLDTYSNILKTIIAEPHVLSSRSKCTSFFNESLCCNVLTFTHKETTNCRHLTEAVAQ